jgi:small subunit ribosomal protein S7
MPRRRKISRREVPLDAKHGSDLVSSFINALMKDGKKGVAEQIMYGAFDLIEERSGKPALEIFKRAVSNVKPMLEVKSRRVGGATYQVPIEVRPSRRQALAIRWIIQFARKRPEHTMQERLARELLDAARKEGSSIKKREDTHKMAEANRAFAHYRW